MSVFIFKEYCFQLFDILDCVGSKDLTQEFSKFCRGVFFEGF